MMGDLKPLPNDFSPLVHVQKSVDMRNFLSSHYNLIQARIYTANVHLNSLRIWNFAEENQKFNEH